MKYGGSLVGNGRVHRGVARIVLYNDITAVLSVCTNREVVRPHDYGVCRYRDIHPESLKYKKTPVPFVHDPNAKRHDDMEK